MPQVKGRLEKPDLSLWPNRKVLKSYMIKIMTIFPIRENNFFFIFLGLMYDCSVSTEPPTVELEVSATAGIQLMAGKTLRIPAVVRGRPVPTRVWTIEEGELDKDRVVIENVGTKSELIIKEALRKDHGRYVITATNSCGSKSAAIRVEVFGKECHMDFYMFFFPLSDTILLH